MWGYESLVSVKEQELETMRQMVGQLEEKLKKAERRAEGLSRKLQGSEQQIDRLKQSSNDGAISYYKERETELLSQMKAIENELFSKNVQIKDEIDCREDRVLADILLQQNRPSPQRTSSKQDAALLPIIHNSETLGKLLQRNLCELEKMTQEKMMLEVKHRMAVLRAAELSVLK
jgi:hypothetical protein